MALTVGVGLVLPALPAFLVGATAGQIRGDLGISEGALGAVVAVLFVTSAAIAPFTGRLADRWGARASILTGTALSFAALCGIGLYARHWIHLVALMVVAGVGLALVDPGLTRMVAGEVPGRRRGMVFGLKEGSIPLATMAAGFAVPTIAVTAGWRWAFAVGVVPLVLVVMLVAGRRPSPAGQPDRSPAPVAVPDRAASPVSAGLLLLATGAAFGSMAATGISVFLTDSALAAGLTEAQGGLLLGMASVAGVVTRIGTGMLADRRTGTARIIPWMLALGSAAMIVGSLGGPVSLAVGAIGAFTGGWGWSALFFLVLVRANPTRPGAAAGVGLSGLAVGNGLGPIAFGTVAQSASFSAAWLMAATSAALAAAFMYRGERLLRQRD